MDLNKFTQKAQEAMVTAQSLAGEYSHGQIAPEHLQLALLRQSDGIVPQVVQKLGADPSEMALLRGEFAEGDSVRVDTRDGRIVFAKAEAEPAIA